MTANLYLLAAGRGTRAGGPKAFLEHEGKPLLRRHLDFFEAFDGVGDVVVSIQVPWLQELETWPHDVQWTPVDPDAWPLASLQELVRARPMGAWNFVLHVDMPVWQEKVFEALLDELADDVDAIVPMYEGRGGHPVLVSSRLSVDLLNLDPATDRLDQFLRSRARKHVDVAHASVVSNWNDGLA